MTGGIVQLVAQGLTDVFLTVDPQITFFKTVFRRHTNFSKAEYDLRFSKKLDFGRTSDVKIQKYGDLLHRLYLVINLPDVDIVFRSLTVAEVQALLQPFGITWVTVKESSELFSQEDFEEVSDLIFERVTELESELDTVNAMLYEITEGPLKPSTWFASTGYTESNSMEYFAYMADFYFQFDPLGVQWQFFIAHRNDRSPFISLANSSTLQLLLFNLFREYATGESVSEFDPASYNDENLFFIFNVDTANYNVSGSTNELTSDTVFRAGIQSVYGSEQYEDLDAYMIFDSFLNQDSSFITSSFDVTRIKQQLITTIRFGLSKNILLLNNVFNSLKNDSKFMFYRPFEERVGGFDTTVSWTNLSLSNNIDVDLQDRYTNDFIIQALPDEPNNLYHPMSEFINTTVNSFHTSNRDYFRTIKFKSYFDTLELWSRTDVGTAGFYKEAITGSPTGKIPTEFNNMYFLNYIPILSNQDVPLAIIKVLNQEKVNATNSGNPQRANSIQQIIDSLTPVLNATKVAVHSLITPVLCVPDDFVSINKMTGFKTVARDIITVAIIRQGEFLQLDGVNYVVPEYVVKRYIKVLNQFVSEELPLYEDEFKDVLINVVNLFALPELSMLDFATYQSLNYNSNPSLIINNGLEEVFSDAVSSVWINIFKTFVNSYNNLYDNDILGRIVYNDSLGKELLSYRDEAVGEILDLDVEAKIQYYFESTLNQFQSKLPVNGGLIGSFLAEKLSQFEKQLVHFTENFKLLNIKSLIISKPTYYFEKFKTVLDFITLDNLETAKAPDNSLVYDHQPHGSAQTDEVLIARNSFLDPNTDKPHFNAMDIFNETDRLFTLMITSTVNPFKKSTDPFKHDMWKKLWIPNKQFDSNVEQAKYDSLFDNITPQTLWTQVTDIDVRFNGFRSDLDIYLYQSDIVLQHAALFTFDVPRILAPTVTESNARAVFFLTVQGQIREANIVSLVGEDRTSGLLSILENSLRGGEPANFAWVKSIGHHIIKKIELYIGDQKVDTQYGEWLHVWHQLTRRAQKERGYNDLIGNVPELYSFNVDKKRKYQLITPLKFFCCVNVGASIPLVALQHTDVHLKVELRTFEELSYHNVFTRFRKKVQLTDCHVIAEYVYLDEEERKRVVSNKHEYLIERLQYNGDLIINKNSVNEEGLITVKFYFQNMIKELVWMVQDTDLINGSLANGEKVYDQYSYDVISESESESVSVSYKINPVSQVKIKFASRDREPFKDAEYYNFIQPYEKHSSTPDLGIHNYCFSIKPENHMQPTGAANLGKLDDCGLEIKLRDEVLADLMKGKIFRIAVYAMSYNVYRVMSGLGGLAFFY